MSRNDPSNEEMIIGLSVFLLWTGFIIVYIGIFSLWTQRSMNYIIPLFKHCELCVTQFPYWLSVLMTVFLSPVIGILNIIIEILRFFL